VLVSLAHTTVTGHVPGDDLYSSAHACRCRHPGPTTVYLASQPTVTGTVNTTRISYLGFALRTARLNDDCRPHPTTVAAAPHYPHTRPPDVPTRLVYQRILVNTYCTSDLCRPRGRARPPSHPCVRCAFALTCSGACVDLPGFGRGRSDMSDREDDVLAARGTLGSRTRRSADCDDDCHRPWRTSDFPSDNAVFERCDSTLTSDTLLHGVATFPELHGVTKAPTARLVRRSTKRAPSLVMVCLPFFATFSTIMVSSLCRFSRRPACVTRLKLIGTAVMRYTHCTWPHGLSAHAPNTAARSR
jgi:hypothetical protein